jgi:hypothetical protein
MIKETFTTQENLSLENSFTVLKQEDNIEIEVTVGINSDTYGWFELYDIETGGGEWHAEGGLWIDGNKKITDYDGVFSLPLSVVGKLKEMGYDTSEVE